MTKIRNIIIILISFFIMMFAGNAVFAEEYTGADGLAEMMATSEPSKYVGSTIYLSYKELPGTNVLYCVAHGKRSRSTDYRTFTIENYVLIEGTKATSANGQTVVENESNAILAAIIGGGLEPGYGSVSSYNPAQQALYKYWDDWLDAVGTPSFGLGAFSNRTRNSQYSSTSANEYLQDAKNLVARGKYFGVGIFFFKDRTSGDYQELILTCPLLLIEDETPQITINKVDKDSKANIAGVTFTIRNKSTNQYIQNINSDYTVTYTSDSNSAYQFKTGNLSTGYTAINIKKLPAGTYILREESTEDSNYYSPTNIGTETTFTVVDNQTVSLQIENTKIVAGDDDDDDDDDNYYDDYEDDPGSGNVTISGIVWEDLFSGKGNTNDSVKGSGEKGIKGVRVYWKDKSGNVIANTTTDSSGYYEMASNIKIYNHTYSINSSQYNKLNNSYIEFQYNGVKYTTVATSKTGSNTSKAAEYAATRTTLDGHFDEVNSAGVYDSGRLRYNLSYNTSTSNTATLNQSPIDFTMIAITSGAGITKLLDNYAETEEGYYCVDEWECEHEDEDGDTWSHTVHDKEDRVDEWHIYNMNLGLVQREQPDLAITSDIQKVRVIMKGQEYTYVYNNRNIQSNTNVTNYCVSFEKKYTPGVYTRPVNPSDIAYIQQDSASDDMEVYVTYIMRVKNQSNTLSVEVKEIVNYYDDDYTLTSSSSAIWSNTSKLGTTYSKNGYKAVYTTTLQNKKIGPGQISDVVSVEYKVNTSTVKKLINQESVLLRNVVEINAYASYYGANTQCAENKKASALGKTNTQYAGIDPDSAPGNATPGNSKTYEDDTEEAPTFKLTKNSEYKIISGTVWEDTDANTADNERLGNGTKQSSEKAVKNVKVELLKVYDDTSTEVAKIYRIENGVSKTYDAVTYTDSSGHYEFEGIVTDNYILKFTYGNDTSVITAGATTINGNVINARNYKSTIVTQEPIKSAIQGNGDNQWHLTAPDNASIAVDDLDERLDVPQLQYSNYDDTINMVAYSAAFKVQVEYTEDQEANVGTDGGSFENDIGIFDFGIIERPRENIVIDKTIENISITLANGQVLTEGNPYNESLNYVKAIGTADVRTREVALKANQKLLSIEMDSELIQGATLDILYAITVINNSEKDYEYDSRLGGNEKYYYYGEIASPLIQQSAEIVIDYVDSELTCTTDDEVNKNWKQYQAEELKDAGYISEATCNTAKSENYLIFITTAFKDIATGSSHTEYLHATKLLANQANDYTYENHAEIIRLNGKIARTIDSVDDNTREQITKQYKPGTYIPSLTRKLAVTDSTHKVNGVSNYKTVNGTLEQAGLHNQDDDMITIRITPPTGLENNIMIYVITAGIALVVIGIGVFIIKKKVL